MRRSECPTVVVLHLLSGSSAAAPPAVGTVLLGASSRDRSRTTLRLAPGCSRSSRHRRPRHPCSASHASTPPRGRHASRCDHTGRGTAYPRFAWPLPLDAVVTAPRDRPIFAGRGSWVASWQVHPLRPLQPCPCVRGFRRRDHPRDPSLRRRSAAPSSPVLRSPRTSAAPRSLWPSAWSSCVALTRAVQTDLPCSVLLLGRVLRSVPRGILRRSFRIVPSQSWPSP